MAAKFIVLIACLALAQCAVYKRETSALQATQQRAEELQKTITEQLEKLTKSPNAQQAQAAIKDGTDAVLQQLSAFSGTLQTALNDANGKAKEVLQTTRTNVEKSVTELRKEHPEVEKQADALKNKLQAAISNTVQQSQVLAKDINANLEETNKKVEPLVKQALDDLVKNFEQVQAKLKEAVNKQ